MLADEAGTILVPAQMANAAHVLGSLHRFNEPNRRAMRAGKRVHLARSRRWTRDDGVSLRLSHYSANISVTTTVDA